VAGSIGVNFNPQIQSFLGLFPSDSNPEFAHNMTGISASSIRLELRGAIHF
jgi:hypothetical protein